MANVNRRELLTILAALGISATSTASQCDGEQNAESKKGIKVGHVDATPDGESHIGDLEILLNENQGRPLFFNSSRFGATNVGF